MISATWVGTTLPYVHSLLTILEDIRQCNCTKLVCQNGDTEAKIPRLDAIGSQNVLDSSHLECGLPSAADEDYQLQLYLLSEVKRRRLITLGKE